MDPDDALMALAADLVDMISAGKAELILAGEDADDPVALAADAPGAGPPPRPAPGPSAAGGPMISQGAYMGHTIAGGAHYPSVGHQLRQQQAAGSGGQVPIREYRRTEHGRPQVVHGYQQSRRPGHGERWVEGAPGHMVTGISPEQWQAGQELWVVQGRATMAARHPPDVTSGLMKAGDWQEGHQAVSAAPVGILGNERSRYVTIDGQQHLINGSWSDPWWMARPGRGWAVSRRWKSAAQTRLDWSGGKSVKVTIPARDERVLVPWTGATEAQARAREVGR